MWIANTGATVHSSPYKQGMENICKPQTADAIMMGNGKDGKAALIGDLKVTMCNKQGVILGTGMIRDVVHRHTGCFNLFSVTKLIKDGWALGADKSALWLTKAI